MLTAEQLSTRRARLSASDFGAILGANPWKTAADVQAEKLFDLEPLPPNEAMEIGNMLEPAVLQWGADTLGVQIEYPLPTIVHPTQPLICATGDAAIVGRMAGLEGKTAGIVRGFAPKEEWGEPGSDHVPDTYKCQTYVQMACLDWQVVYLAALIAGRGRVLYEIPRSNDDIESLIVIGVAWWKRHIIDQEPCVAADGTEVYPALDTLKRIRREPNAVRHVSGDLIRRMDEAKAALKAAEEAEEVARCALLAGMGDAEAVEGFDGGISVGTYTYFSQSRRSIDTALLKSRFPKAAAECEKVSTFPVLRRKK